MVEDEETFVPDVVEETSQSPLLLAAGEMGAPSQ